MIINSMKYKVDAACPIPINGSSTGCPPIQVKISVLNTNSQNKS